MYKSIFIDGKITNPKTGNTLDLRIYDTTLGAEKMPYLQSITIKTGYNIDMDISMVLAPPYDEALKIMSQDNEWFRMGNTLALRWGYSDVDGAISDWHMGFMMLPQPDFGEEITITVPAISQGATSNRVSRLRCWSSPEHPRTFKSVAEEIARHYGMVVQFRSLDPIQRKDLMELERVDLVHGGKTDLQFLASIAAQRGVQLVVQNNKFIFSSVNEAYWGKKSVGATFHQYGKMDAKNNIFPLNSFSPESMGTLFLQNHQGLATFVSGPNTNPEENVRAVVVTGTDNDSNYYSSDKTANAPTKEGAASNLKNSDGTVNTAKSTVSTDITQMQAGRYIPVAMSTEYTEEEAKKILNSARDSDASDEGITVNFTSIALPFVIPGMYVKMAGVGDYFSAVYMLVEREISISDGSAEMNCVARTMGYPGLNADLDSFVDSVKKHEKPTEEDPKNDLVVPLKDDADGTTADSINPVDEFLSS